MATGNPIEKLNLLHRLRGFILDMDGVLYRGHQALPGAKEFLGNLEANQLRYILATNNSTQTPKGFAAKLSSLGLEVSPSRILTSAQAAALFLAQKLPRGAAVYTMGGEGIAQALREQGFILAKDKARAVVAGMDLDLSYERLKTATRLIRQGALFIGTNPDRTYPTEEGLVPGAGAVLAALEAASGISPIIIGKPEPHLFQIALERLGTPPPETGCIGDRLETDILGGKKAGLITILLLSGVARREEIESAPAPPDFVFQSLIELSEALF